MAELLRLSSALLTATAVLGSVVAQKQPPTKPDLHFPPEFDELVGGDARSIKKGTGPANVGKNLLLNRDNTTRWQDEFSLAINPTNPDNFLASANDYRSGRPALGRYTSLDGGKTIVADGTLPLAGFQDAGDPAVAFDGFGNGYIMGLHFNRSPLSGAIFIHKTVDGGRTFQAPVRAFFAGNLPDKPFFTIDQRTSGRFAGSLYITFTGFFGPPTGLNSIYSRDGGATWSAPVPIGGGQGTSPAVGPNGELYVSWQNGNRIQINRSTDGGATFAGARTVANIARNPSPLPPTRFRCNSFPTTAVDRSTGPYRGRVHVCWSSRSGSSSEIFAAFSDDGGTTWSTPVRVNDVAAGDQFFQWMAVDESGTVYACWHDRRNDTANRTYECYASASFDGGRTWFRNWKVSESVNDPASSAFIGDYSGLDARRGRAFATWVDFRRGNQDAFAAAVQTDFEFAPTTVSAAAGGTIACPIKAGPARAGDTFVVVANFTGTNAGIPLGGATFYLNNDPLVSYSLAMGNSAPFLGFRGVLGAGGFAPSDARLVVPGGGVISPLVGGSISLQYVLLTSGSISYGSNPVSVSITR